MDYRKLASAFADGIPWEAAAWGKAMSHREEFNRRYEGVMRYYGVRPLHTNPASPNENGDAEQSHHRFKRAVEQALLLRGSRDFTDMAEYRQFLKDLFV